jgi:hypothetical protein
MSTALILALAAAAFAAVLRPLFRKFEPIPQERPEEEMRSAVQKSIQELRTDLQLQKIHGDDLSEIEAYLEKTSRES